MSHTERKHAVITDISRPDCIIAAIKRKATGHGVCHSTVEAETEAAPSHDSPVFSDD
ncbi:MAG: hypothetical protein K2F91_06225 [Muribaculaceae bacterium]|nr:hypothetical protein [Muribaculaceae bacterium]